MQTCSKSLSFSSALTSAGFAGFIGSVNVHQLSQAGYFHYFLESCFQIDISFADAAGGPETEEAICEAGGVPALLSLITKCSEQPDQATLLEPAAIALSNLAAGTEAHKERIVDAGALPALVKLLSHQVSNADFWP